ncbi:MAG: AAA family ATPase [Thermoplasmata archaeon]
MQLSYLKVKNFRSIESLELGEFGQVTTFFGPNNTGKSNILSAIRFGVYGTTEPHPTPYFTSLSSNRQQLFDIYQNDTSLDVEVTLELGLELDDTLRMLEVLEVERPQDFNKGFSEDDLAKAKTLRISRSLRMDEHGSQMTIEELSLGSKNVLGASYTSGRGEVKSVVDLLKFMVEGCLHEISAFRKFSHETDRPAFRSMPSSWISGEDMKKALFNLSHSEDGEDRKNFAEIHSAFSSPPFSYGSFSVVRSQEGSNDLRIMVDRESFEVPIEYLGSGPQQVLMVLTNVLRRKGHIVAIEEPECNLSPESQREFSKKLIEYTTQQESPIGQLLISTHSTVFGFQGTRFMVSHDGEKTIVKEVKSEEDEKEALDHFAPTWKDYRPLSSGNR